nr:MAG TPA: hypothetical protein [Caudoviricetes sp.]
MTKTVLSFSRLTQKTFSRLTERRLKLWVYLVQ